MDFAGRYSEIQFFNPDDENQVLFFDQTNHFDAQAWPEFSISELVLILEFILNFGIHSQFRN